jgi:hypothetical protein
MDNNLGFGLIGSDEVARCLASRIAISVPSAEHDAWERFVEEADGCTLVPPLDVLVVLAERRIHETCVKIIRDLRNKLVILKIKMYHKEKQNMSIFISYKENQK